MQLDATTNPGARTASGAPARTGPSPSLYAGLVAALLIGVYVWYFTAYSLRQFAAYGDPAFDMGIFDQGVWLLSHFQAPFVTVMGRNLFGDHASFVLLLVVPFYWLFPYPQTLLVLQTLAIAGGAVPVFLLASKRLRSPTLAVLFVAAYLANPALQNGNLEQFHPEAFLVLGIAIAVYAAVESKGVLLAVGVVLCLLVKEDAAVLVVPLGLWVLVRRNRSWGIAVMAGGIAWALFDYLVVIWTILGTPGFYANRVPFGGVGGTLRTVFAHPGRFWQYLTAQGRPFYLWQLGSSVGWVFLLAPEIAAIGLLSAAENVLSTDPYMHQILYHYSMPLVPVLVLGTVYAVGRRRRAWVRWAATAVVLASAITSCVLWGQAPFSAANRYSMLDPSAPTNVAATALEQKVPPNAVVSAWYPYVAHLDHRKTIYLWPNPFSASYWGLERDTGARLPGASHVQYLLLPVALAQSDDPNVFDAVRPSFHVVASQDGVVLYQRNR